MDAAPKTYHNKAASIAKPDEDRESRVAGRKNAAFSKPPRAKRSNSRAISAKLGAIQDLIFGASGASTRMTKAIGVK